MKDYLRIAAAVPPVRPADVAGNLARTREILGTARARRAEAVVLPELGLTGYTCADLFHRPSLLAAAEDALRELLQSEATRGLVAVVGLPVRVAGRIYNCAAVLSDGELNGVVPKTFLANTREFYEARWFASALDAAPSEIALAGATVPFGNDLVFDHPSGAVLGVELCEDLWAPNPPSARLALAGANVLLNLSASDELVGKADYRRGLVLSQSARCLAAYVYAGAGVGESSTDLVYGGHALVAENGTLLAEGPRFSRDPQLALADVDLGFLDFERSASFSFRRAPFSPVRHVPLAHADTRTLERPHSSTSPTPQTPLLRPVDPRPFVPSVRADRDARCEEILAIQSAGLATRLSAVGCRDVVLGLSGGLDSALALLVCVEAFRRLGLPFAGIHCYTLPGFGTTARTKGNAGRLCDGLGVPLETVDISPTARQNLSDLGRDESVHDIAYENAQARGRTYFLMNKANQIGGLVVGTGDLSELALGWCTYNGDHMSMYGVNAGVPKTLVRYIVDWYAGKVGGEAAAALRDILATPVSPELLPANADGTIAQVTEDKVGPYELHDFFLYHVLRRGASKEKVHALALQTFADAYDAATVAKWLDVFFHRFRTRQFKRSCLPDGPKVGSVCLSPRGDWRMPSDAASL